MHNDDFPPHATNGEVYGPAMKITEQTEADAYFEKCVRNMRRYNPQCKAEDIVRRNFGYYAGYYDDETRLRVERLFRCVQPMLGKIADERPTNERAFAAGVKWAAGEAQTEATK